MGIGREHPRMGKHNFGTRQGWVGRAAECCLPCTSDHARFQNSCCFKYYYYHFESVLVFVLPYTLYNAIGDCKWGVNSDELISLCDNIKYQFPKEWFFFSHYRHVMNLLHMWWTFSENRVEHVPFLQKRLKEWWASSIENLVPFKCNSNKALVKQLWF